MLGFVIMYIATALRPLSSEDIPCCDEFGLRFGACYHLLADQCDIALLLLILAAISFMAER